MQKKIIKELETEVKYNISDLVSLDMAAEPDEYENKLKAVKNELNVIETINKIETENKKTIFDKEARERELDLNEERLNFEKEKFNADQEYKNNQLKLEKEKIELSKNEFKLKSASEQNNYELKEREFIAKQSFDKKQLIVTVAVAAVPAVIGLVSNLIAIRHYNKLAIRALNMEYIDNSITPRSYNECMNNIKNFVSKK